MSNTGAKNGVRVDVKRRSGFTVLEVLVCIAVIGVLLGLVLPAIMNARESSRSMDCRNRLRQIGLASHSFHDAHREFPRMHRYLHSLMPYLDLQNLHDRIAEFDATGSGVKGYESFGAAPVFACPSSDVNPSEWEVSYVRSMGTRLDPLLQGGKSNGTIVTAFLNKDPIRVSHVTDGTSNTAFWSETMAWQQTVIRNQESEPGLYWRQIAARPNSMRELQDLCATADGRHEQNGSRHTFLLDKYYQHITPPNTLPCAWDFAVFTGIASKPPSSAHVGGLNVLLVDGSVRFVTNSIDELAWRELGSRNSDDDFDRF